MRRTRPVVRTIVACSAALVACSSSHPSSQATTAASATGAPPLTANGTTEATTTTVAPTPCTLGASYAPGTARHTLSVDGEARELLVHIPPRPAAHMHLVVDFHGAGSNMQQQAVYSGFDAVADARGFVVATPNGAVVAGVRQWRFLNAHDIDFAAAIVDELAANACVDAHHAAATGISSGGAMTAALDCRAGDHFAAFAPVAADFYNDAFCGAGPPRPLMIFHGTADPLVPYDGGRAPGGLSVQPAETSAAAWAKHDGCRSGPTRTRVGSEVVRLDWTGCAEPVVMYRIEGGGHTWPGARIPVARLGATTHQVDATAQMADFFATYA